MKSIFNPKDVSEKLPEVSVQKPKCNTCHYSIGATYWFCRRHPPVVAHGEFSQVVVKADGWCGEHKEREDNI